MASASGSPTRAANWPISRRVTARPCSSTPTGKAHQLERVGLVPLADPTRSRTRAGRNPRRPARAAAGIRGQRVARRDLDAGSSDSGADRQRERTCLAYRFSRPHPAWSRATALDSGENRRMTSVAVSPDGRWLAVGGWKEAGVRVWDLRRRRLERILRPNDALGDMHFFIGFSPDGRWLVSCTASASSALHFWRVGTWELGRRIGIERTGAARQSGIHQRRPADGPRDRLRPGVAGGHRLRPGNSPALDLAAPDPTPLAFRPDGAKLIASPTERPPWCGTCGPP